MAGKALVPFSETVSTFALEGELSPANQVPVNMVIEQEAEHITTTPLAILLALASEGTPKGAKKGSAYPLVRPTPQGGPSVPRSTLLSVKKIPAGRDSGRSTEGSRRTTMGALVLKDIAVHLFTDPLPPKPLEEGQEYVYSLKTKSGDVVSHNYVTTPTRTSKTPSPPQHFHVVGIRTPGICGRTT